MEPTGEQLKYSFLNNHASLVRRLSTSSILPYIYSAGLITLNERDRISGLSVEGSKTDALLEVVHRQGVANPEVYAAFFHLLSDEAITAGQNLGDLLKKISRDSTSEEIKKKFQYTTKKLEESDRLLLDKHRSVIIQTVSAENVLPELVSSGSVSIASKEKIMAEKTQDDQAKLLLKVICEGGSPSVDIFIAVLEESDKYKTLGGKLKMEREVLSKKSGDHHRKQRTVIDHSVLLEDLKEISAGWEKFGVQLGIPLSTLKKFREEVTGMDGLVDYCLNRIIEAWLMGDPKKVNQDFLVRAISAVGGYPKVISEIQTQDFPIRMKSLPKILRCLRPMKDKYAILGTHLGIGLNDIKKFEKQEGDADRCMSEVLSHWLRMKGEDAPDKQTLWEALEEIGYVGLAETLKEEYKDIDFPK